MDKDLFLKSIEILRSDKALKREPMSDSVTQFLQTWNVPQEVIDFLRDFSFSTPLLFKHVYFDYVNDMAEFNLEEQNKPCINNALLIVGSGLNGDPIVLDLNTLKVGYVFHDELWEQEDENCNPREKWLINLDCSIGQFFLNSLTQDDYPVDAYEAEKYIKK